MKLTRTSTWLLVATAIAGCPRSATTPPPGEPSVQGGDLPRPEAGAAPAGEAGAPGAAACIDYPDVGYRTFPFDPHPPAESSPPCTPRCHPRLASAGAGVAALDQDLPAGPCDEEGATCGSGLRAGWCGPCLDTGGPGNGYRCACRGHRWQCALISVGGAVCSPPTCLGPGDGGICLSATHTATQVCACGNCRTLCDTGADCPSGVCRPAQVCFPVTCPGPDECPATCRGLCQ
jgi:hypothetical protein